jgi:hypothetical protein
MTGVSTNAIFKLRPTIPRDIRNGEKGFTRAKAKIVGTNNRKIGTASFHFGPKSSKIMSSANRAQAIVMGRVSDMTSE